MGPLARYWGTGAPEPSVVFLLEWSVLLALTPSPPILHLLKILFTLNNTCMEASLFSGSFVLTEKSAFMKKVSVSKLYQCKQFPDIWEENMKKKMLKGQGIFYCFI